MRRHRLPLLPAAAAAAALFAVLVVPDHAAAVLLQTPHPALAVYGAVRVRGADEAAGDAGFYAAPGRALDLLVDGRNGTTKATTAAGRGAVGTVPDVYSKLTLRRAGPRHQLSVMTLSLQPPNDTLAPPTTPDGGGGFAIDADGRFVHRSRNPRGLWDACGRPGDYRLAVGGRAAAVDGLEDCIRNISLIVLH